MTGRAYMGEVLNHVLVEIHQEMSELLDKQVNAQKEKIFRGNTMYSALWKLREINPLYREIQLPADASELGLNLSITEHIS